MTEGNNRSITKTPPPPGSRLALYSLITGVLALLGVCFIPSGILLGVVGVALAYLSKNQSKAYSGNAIAGTVLSVIAIVLTFIIFLIYIKMMEVIKDPVLGPQVNQEMWNQLDQMKNSYYNYFRQLMQ